MLEPQDREGTWAKLRKWHIYWCELLLLKKTHIFPHLGGLYHSPLRNIKGAETFLHPYLCWVIIFTTETNHMHRVTLPCAFCILFACSNIKQTSVWTKSSDLFVHYCNHSISGRKGATSALEKQVIVNRNWTQSECWIVFMAKDRRMPINCKAKEQWFPLGFVHLNSE